MKSSKYFPINKSIIKDGTTHEFNLFIPINSNKNMKLVDGYEIINTTHTLYVHESEYEKYECYRNSVLESNDIEEIMLMSFEEKSYEMYKNASTVLNNLFSNPETLANYEASKEVVNNMLKIILDDDFTIKSLLNIAEHDYYTHTHSINVAIYALSLGSFLNLTPTELTELGEAALLHDLGKSKIDASIINKNDKLTNEEFEEVKKHPSLGYTLALRLGVTNKKILHAIRQHHEKMDASGYPMGLGGQGISLYARIIALCDIFDALTSKRSYKKPMTTFEAFLLIKKNMSNHIDSNILRNMIEMFK
ncbi:MAG: HD-GYP domain-containing protein [Sulfurimonas sp.]|uniref:HD-GYP domain-containing protein n=1 Tax=Sulfurimonas sp. TaxID=2022749 RepID=UPI003D13E608